MILPAFALVSLILAQPTTSAAAMANRELLEAARAGQVTRVKELLSTGADANTVDRRGFTPLMWACANGTPGTLRLLLDGGAALDSRSSDGMTALMLASANGFVEGVRALLGKGADVNAGRNGVKPRQVAVERGHAEIAALLEQAEALAGRLLRAAAEGNDTAVRQALAAGAPVNATDDRGATALMIAARNGDLGMLQVLLARGADVTARDTQKQGVFEWAESSSTGKYVVALLADRGIARDSPRAGAASDAPQVRASLGTLAMMLSRLSTSSARVRAAQRRANVALSQLQALSAQWPAESPADYRDNLAGDVKALTQALESNSVETLAATIESVAEDLEVKLEHCNRSGGKLGGSVTVRVRTVHGGDEIRSWQVFYMPRVFEAAANATPDLFPQLSSPTEDTLVPGRYVMWVRDPATARVGERTIVKVGEGRKELLLDLPVPAAAPR